ncbi:MAG: hypothetical protein H6662_10265 [Ardenticatenaceae bacterium]|nr:hypothetical protein [Ardenticatenaceae bacterium]MCB8989535.1 hypothetical protein [Ardenticatenaceae bacterium]MCB9003078.1 hypothetical protein [Ardenticatenaceae bacterium]
MFTQELLQELVSYNPPQGNVLSLYLDTDSTQQSIDTIKLQAKGLLKEVQANHNQETTAIERYLDHSFDWSKPGLALFSAADGDFFRAYPVAVSFRNRLRVGQKPYLKPLAHFFDYYAHYGVVLVDRLGARFFEFHLGELQDTAGFMGEDVRKLKKGGGSSAVGMRGGQGGGRHESEVAQRNLRDSAESADAFFREKQVRRLFLCGTPETVAQFRGYLSKQLQSCIAATCAMDMNAGEHEVRARSLQMLRQNNEEREQELVANVLNAAAAGGSATLGLDDTLQAICDKRIQLLVLSDGYRTPGYVHEESGYVVANLAKSPLSDKELTAVSDIIDTAVTFTLAQGGRIEVINGNSDLEAAGRIGAMLRY